MFSKILLNGFLPLALCMLLSGCLSESYYATPDPDPGTNQNQQGKIFYKIYVDLDYPPANGASSCHIAPGGFLDDNPGMPDNANFNQFYGPCPAGTYNAQFTWDMNSASAHYQYYTYTLQEPPAGYKRNYTHVLIDYDPSLNRCLNYSHSPGYLTYVDEKL